jgi:hypothetical protein
MDAQAFDRWTAALARRPSRRVALRLLAGSLIAGLLPLRRTSPVRAAQRPDRDGDGLYDDDETDIYFTNPDVYDTDGDGVGDGEEVYLGTNLLVNENAAPPPTGCAAGLTDCGGICVDLVNDRNHCGRCGGACAEFVNCWESNCGGIPDPPITVTCAAGLADCGGVCADVLTDQNNCGICGWVCGGNDICMNGICVLAECPSGTTRCGPIGICYDLLNDSGNCGVCDLACSDGLICCSGNCMDILNDIYNCGGCGRFCFGGFTCENGQCV